MCSDRTSESSARHIPQTYRNAQDLVATLCRNLNASVQRADEDDNGYDLIAEFPSRVQTAFPDTAPPLIRCLIQVKSTQTRRKTTRVKLSNALKFAKEKLPCFVVLVTYPNNSKIHEAIYLRHVWTTDMTEALKSAREQSSKSVALNRKHLNIAFAANERVDDLLADKILDAVAETGREYSEKKKLIGDSLGYENGWGEGHFVFADGHDDRDLQDLILGKRDKLPLQSFTFQEKRFGILGEQTTTGPGNLSISKPPRARCVLTLQKRGLEEQLSWAGAVFAAGMDWLPPQEQKVRVVAGPIEILFTLAGDMSANWSAPLDTPRTLEDLASDARFRSWMDGSAIDLEVWSDSRLLLSSRLEFSKLDDEVPWATVVEATQALARVAPPERRPHELKVSMSDFVRDLDRLEHLSRLLNPDATAMCISNESGLEPELESATHIVFPWVGRLGEHFVVAVVERGIRSAHLKANDLYLSTEHGRALRGTTMHASGATEALVAAEVEWVRARAETSDRKILSYHPDSDGSGFLMLTTPD